MKGKRFFFEDFSTSCKTSEEHKASLILKNVCIKLVEVMGGTKSNGRMLCDFNVYFLKDNIKLFQGPMQFKNVSFKFITESYFHWIRLNEEDFYANNKK